MIKRISTYLTVLGIVQLLGLNLGGIFWFFWAKGIAEKKQSSRHWVIAIHSICMGLCAYALGDWLLRPNKASYLMVFGNNIGAGRAIVLAVLVLMFVAYGLPVIWLMRKDIKKEFIEQGVAGYGAQSAPSPER